MSKVWRAWKRFRRKRGVGPLVLALVAIDLATKHTLVTQSWAWHPSDQTVLRGAVVIGFGLLTALYLSGVAGALIAAGAAGNGLAALMGPVANPFVLAHWNMAFNLADVYLWIGFALVLVLSVSRAKEVLPV